MTALDCGVIGVSCYPGQDILFHKCQILQPFGRYISLYFVVFFLNDKSISMNLIENLNETSYTKKSKKNSKK